MSLYEGDETSPEPITLLPWTWGCSLQCAVSAEAGDVTQVVSGLPSRNLGLVPGVTQMGHSGAHL